MKNQALAAIAAVFVSGVSLADDPNAFPELVYADIPGAPKLSAPKVVMGEKAPVIAQGLGWIAPAYYDWDGDGKKDLLMGEFGSGYEHGSAVGNFIRVYLNQGTTKEPKFSNEFRYAHYGRDESPNGTPISINTWCCIGIAPQFIDLDGDGRKDMITGQYHPGDVTLFRGLEKGFAAGKKLPQEGNTGANKNDAPLADNKSFSYWLFSAASFGDFDGDDKADLIVGGLSLRMSKNIGTKTEPRFGAREVLLDTGGKPLMVRQPTEKDKAYKPYGEPGNAGIYNTMPLVVDWDQDGTLDLLVTSGYYYKDAQDMHAVTFFRGVKTKDGPRFEPGKPLFTAKNGGKAFPGSWLRAYVEDWNDDGVNDLLIGTSVATLNGGQFSQKLSWEWEIESNILKHNYGYESAAEIAKRMETMKKIREKQPDFKDYLMDGGDPSLVHHGYVYVMLGRK